MIELGKGLIKLGIGLIELGIGLIELGKGLMELGIGLRIITPGAPSWPVYPALFEFFAFIHSLLLPKCFSDPCHCPSHLHATGEAVHPALFMNEVLFSFTEMEKKL